MCPVCAIGNDFKPTDRSVMPGEFAAVDGLINELHAVGVSHVWQHSLHSRLNTRAVCFRAASFHVWPN